MQRWPRVGRRPTTRISGAVTAVWDKSVEAMSSGGARDVTSSEPVTTHAAAATTTQRASQKSCIGVVHVIRAWRWLLGVVSTTCMGYCGTPCVGLVFARSISWCGASFPRCYFAFSFVPAFSFDVDDEERAVDGVVGFGWCAGLGFFLQDEVLCLFSPVTRGGSQGCFGTVWCAPALDDVSQQGVPGEEDGELREAARLRY